MRGLGTLVGGALFIASIFAGWWAIDRVQEHLPEPVNAVIDSVQNAGSPSGGPFIQPLDEVTRGVDPLDGCPEFAADVRVIEQAVRKASPVSQAQADANNELLSKEITRIADGGATRPLAASGVAAALRDQADALEANAAALPSLELRTPEARSLATGLATAASRVAEADRRFTAQRTGTRAQWTAWMESISGPLAQADAATKGLSKCPS